MRVQYLGKKMQLSGMCCGNIKRNQGDVFCFVLHCCFLQRLRVSIVYLNVSFSRSALSSLSHRSKRYALAALSSGENSITVVPHCSLDPENFTVTLLLKSFPMCLCVDIPKEICVLK